MEEGPQSERQSGINVARIETLADGVFAIAMTLLILNLKVPAVSPHDRLLDVHLWNSLRSDSPNVLSYVLSFVVLGIYWIGLHSLLPYLRRTDRGLVWINIIFLMGIAFLPLPTGLLARYAPHRTAVVVYGLTLTFIALALFAQWWYATAGHRLVEPGLSADVMRSVTRKLLFGPLVFLLAVIIAFIRPELSPPFFVLVLIVSIFTRATQIPPPE